MFKKEKKNMSKSKGDVEEIEKTQVELLKVEYTLSKVKINTG